MLAPDQARIELIGAFLYAPLTGHQQLNGWLALGPKQTGQIYSADDLAFLNALTSQTALALERAVVFDDLERRVNELNALSRISQAVNFTLDPDDILELIYTQTSRVIDTRNFYIALADAKRGTMRFAFYVEGNERLYPDDEWPIETGLSGEIMRHGQPIITDDYVKECEKRGLEGRRQTGPRLDGCAAQRRQRADGHHGGVGLPRRSRLQPGTAANLRGHRRSSGQRAG